jgi:hypothetical protein
MTNARVGREHGLESFPNAAGSFADFGKTR